MGWTTPHTYANDDVVTDDNLNETRDNLNDLDRRATVITETIATSETTSSTSFTDLSTSGPVVSATAGDSGLVLVIVTATMSSGTNGDGAAMSYAISGGTTEVAADTKAVSMISATAGNVFTISASFVATVVAGSNAFTAKYRAVTGGTATFANRTISVVPLSG